MAFQDSLGDSGPFGESPFSPFPSLACPICNSSRVLKIFSPNLKIIPQSFLWPLVGSCLSLLVSWASLSSNFFSQIREAPLPRNSWMMAARPAPTTAAPTALERPPPVALMSPLQVRVLLLPQSPFSKCPSVHPVLRTST